MRRSLKYGLGAAVLALLVGGGATVVVAAPLPRRVTLVVDGARSDIRTTASTVGAALSQAGYPLTGHDSVAPPADSAVVADQTVTLRRGRLVHLSVDGQASDVWTTDLTVGQLVLQLGYSSGTYVSQPPTQPLPLTASSLTIRTPRSVTLVLNGKSAVIQTTALTVADVLGDSDIVLAAGDSVQPQSATIVTAGLTITVATTVTALAVIKQPIAFGTTQVPDPTLPAGTTQVTTKGVAGELDVTYREVSHGGKLLTRTKVSSKVVRKPVAQVVRVGTQPAPPAPQPAPAAPSQPAPPQPGDPGYCPPVLQWLCGD